MCGITGIYNFSRKKPVDEKLLIKMRDVMAHRGPDDYGVWFSDTRHVGLAHRRLSIIDMSKSANQPMSNEDGRIWITYNGEIYNHAEIRKELEASGHIFKTDHSDTEVIIHSYEEWGHSCLDKFRGMFAFAIWDSHKEELFIARDRIGIKPVYYTFHNGDFVFASEIKSILQDNSIPREVDDKAFYDYLSFLVSPAPDTMFKNIKKLQSSSFMIINKTGDLKIVKYWDVLDKTQPLINVSEDEICSLLLSELKTSVAYRGISDVPVGIFLSGGVDSSINTALFSEGRGKIKTFTIGYEGEHRTYKNEFDYAKIIAEKVNSEHHIKKLKMEDLIDFLPTLTYFEDEPLADPVCFSIYHVSKLAIENGINVCQVGEGSDELFWGYDLWKIILRLQKLSSIPYTGLIKKAGLSVLNAMGKKSTIYYEWLKRGTKGLPIFWGGAESFTENQKTSIISQELRKQFQNYSSFEVIEPIFQRFKEKAWEKTPFNWMAYLDLNFRLPELLLMRVDKMSMANSLEARVPFLDHKFVELAMSIPEKIKTKNGVQKYILKKSVKGIIPDELIYRKKQGFDVPVYEWFFQKFGDVARNELMGFCSRTNYYDKDTVVDLLDRGRGREIWFLLNFALWHKKWIEGLD